MKFSAVSFIAISLIAIPVVANAQQQWANTSITTVAQPGIQYVDLGGVADSTSVACTATLAPPTDKFCADGKGISLDQFANESDVENQFDTVDNSLSQLNSGLGTTNGNVAQLTTGLSATNAAVSQLTTAMNNANTKLAAIQNQLNNSVSRQNRSFGQLYDLVAVSAALKDAVPLDGDRFALRVNMGGYQGHFAGAIGGSINISDRVRFSMNYGHGKSEQIFSGGLNFSFQ